jgi:hypothetical protein
LHEGCTLRPVRRSADDRRLIGIELVMRESGKTTRTLIGADRSLDELDTTTSPMTATPEELKLVQKNRMHGRVAAYSVRP